MERVLVSACLLGHPVRYDAAGKPSGDDILQRWIAEGRVVSLCPEVAGGLPVPRPPAEIAGGAGGPAVLARTAPVVAQDGTDVSAEFIAGAKEALAAARAHDIRVAVLKEGSPSCGSHFTYDGTFSRSRVAQPGVATAALNAAGVRVFSETEWAEADRLLRVLEARAGSQP